MDGFSKCQTDSHVPDGDSAKLYEILNKMSESLLLLSAEECDLNGKWSGLSIYLWTYLSSDSLNLSGILCGTESSRYLTIPLDLNW